MDYHTYENWRAKGHTATVHVGSCGCCKDGKGQSGRTRTDNGLWLGPYTSLAGAKNAVQLVKPKLHRCVH